MSQLSVFEIDREIAFSLSDALKSINSNTGVDKAEKTIIEGLGKEWVIKRSIIDVLNREQIMTFWFNLFWSLVAYPEVKIPETTTLLIQT